MRPLEMSMNWWRAAVTWLEGTVKPSTKMETPSNRPPAAAPEVEASA
jgi:hypothetical protein